MSKSITEVMTSNPRTVGTSTAVAEAAKVMKQQDVGSVPIVEDERLVGVVTDRDLALRVVAEGRDPATTPVGEIASRDIVTLDPQQSIDEAAELMAKHQVRRLPVVEEDGRLVGIVAQADVAQYAAQYADDALIGRVVERISQ